MPKIAKQTVSPRIFRHFAVFTLAATFCLAIFAEGESRQAVAETIKRAEREAEFEREKIDKQRYEPMVIAPPKEGASNLKSFYTDTGPSLTTPTNRPAARKVASEMAQTAWAMLGMTKEEWDSLPAAERALLLSKLSDPSSDDPDGRTVAEIRQNQAETLIEASLQRSGSTRE